MFIYLVSIFKRLSWLNCSIPLVLLVAELEPAITARFADLCLYQKHHHTVLKILYCTDEFYVHHSDSTTENR